ncbi:hypothetical protein [Dictyobacter aurantiacus]|uniref:Uncharacterized protein n=1 Tax=Dictyobacter aurantiacus TaxID=1936993 RepID=A0A401ZHJ1_9CHLR|nr:hypothetical protein [Dictyobacter aurantiacus]GCE06351.1 hypothetical protein KDAU_36800 [Dictyobacter aurantiacus]
MPNYGQPLQDYGPWEGETVPGWFDVAIWPAGLGENRMPLYAGYIKAATAFQAIEDAMRNYGLCRIAYACARALDGSICYRAFKVFVTLDAVQDDWDQEFDTLLRSMDW